MWNDIALLGVMLALSYYSFDAGYQYGCKVTRQALAGAADTHSRISQDNTQSRIERPGPCDFSNIYGRCILMHGHAGKHELETQEAGAGMSKLIAEISYRNDVSSEKPWGTQSVVVILELKRGDGSVIDKQYVNESSTLSRSPADLLAQFAQKIWAEYVYR